MGDNVNPVPEGFHTVTPYVTVRGAAGAIEFYKRAFGARETSAGRIRTGTSGTPRS
jgi:PhnB protein